MKHSADFEGMSRPVVALDDEYVAGFVDPLHRHRRAQVLFACAGVMSVVTDTGSYVVPPQRALWIPPGCAHEVQCRGSVSLRTLYIEPAVQPLMSERACVLEVSEFLKALILEVMTFDAEYDLEGREGRIVALLLDELARMPDAPYHAAMPQDERLLRVCKAILADPSDRRTLDDWAAMAAMGRRTFTRLFKDETGMGLAVWRQQVRLMEALSHLAAGASVTTVAYDVGYESPSAFTAMFHRAFGMPPSQYMTDEAR